jgi:ferredoxin
MADQNKRLDSNVSGNFYVDATCINCDTCRQLAPASFEEVGNFSAVTSQPTSEGSLHQAYQALLSCPVGSIGTERGEPVRMQEAMASFPLHLEEGVYYCGFNSEKSFGANSFFLEHPDGNWLIDSPRYLKHLVEAFERKGGLSHIFLTHKDDVAEAEKYAAHFGAKRIIHRADLEAAPGAEWIIEDVDSSQILPEFQIIPVPGHTAGSMALLYKNRFLFTGDHLWWDSKQPAGLEKARVAGLTPETPRLPVRMGLGGTWGWHTIVSCSDAIAIASVDRTSPATQNALLVCSCVSPAGSVAIC